MTDLSQIEARIVELCERAKAKGWRFTTMSMGNGVTCGCPLQFAASEFGIEASPDREEPWVQAAHCIGVRAVSFGSGFDAVANGGEPTCSDDHFRLGARLARRFVEGVE